MKSKILLFLLAVVVAPVAVLRAVPDTNVAVSVPSSTTNVSDENSFYGDFLFSDLIVAGEIMPGGRNVVTKPATTDGTGILYYYYYPFKVSEVIKGKAPSEETIEVAVVWSGEKGDPFFMKTGDKLILFLEGPNKKRSAWLVTNRSSGVQPMNPQRIESLKKFIADGPTPPFSAWGHLNGIQDSTLDVRISAVTNVIAAVPKHLTNGRTDVLELPIRIENDSTQTITARISHEWFGGIWPPTDLGAAVRRIDDESGNWQMCQVYLSDELGTEPEPTVWQPGQSHIFVLRMNWPGTGSMGSRPLIDANLPGNYAVRVSLIFKDGKTSEYVSSPQMNIEVRKKSHEEVTPADSAK